MALDNAEDDKDKGGTRVFKKSSPNGKITVYLGKRDFFDHSSHADPIDGVILVDPEYVGNQKVYAHVLAAFRYGREDLDVLGLTFRKDLYLASAQVYPPENTHKRPLSRLQERLLKKLGDHAYPFHFELPPQSPASVTLQPAPGDTGKPCGVDYELKAYIAPSLEEKSHKKDTVRLAVRKLYYAPDLTKDQPCVEVSKEFVMSSAKLHLEVSLDKEMYYHGESIAINVQITNNSYKSVKRIKVAVLQIADICLFSTAKYKCTVAEIESEPLCREGFPVGPGFTLSKVYYLTPLLANNKDKRGLALDGKLKHEDTNLASSTIVRDSIQKENLGIIVQYRVRVKLVLGGFSGDLVAELPFTLTHPKPKETPPPSRPDPIKSDRAKDKIVDENLIQLDTNDEKGTFDEQDDDIIFEDFARLRLKGAEGDDAEA